MQDLLSQLKDIHVQTDIAWQLAWGWWVLMLFLVITLVILIFFILKIWQKRTLKIKTKHALEVAINANNPAISCLLVLRSYANFYYPDADISTFNERQWRKFLAQKLPFNEELDRFFSESMYQKEAKIDKEILLSYCQKWVNRV